MEELYLERWCRLVEDKLSWGSSKEWTNFHFNKLSKIVSDASEITISPDTFRRLFKKKVTNSAVYNPQVATKDALAIFLGFKDWAHFKKSQTDISHPDLPGEKLPEVSILKGGSQKSFPSSKFIFFSLVGVILLILIIVSFSDNLFKSSKAKIVFINKTPEGKAPFSPLFNYDVSSVEDSVFIVFGHRFPPLFLDKNQKTVTFLYHLPDFYNVFLVTRKDTLATSTVNLKTDDWEAFIDSNGKKRYHYLNNKLIRKNGTLLVLPLEVKNFAVDTMAGFWIDYRNIRTFEASGDNCVLEARFKNYKKEIKPTGFNVEVELIGEKGKMRSTITDLGYSRFAKMEVGEIFLEGEYVDLLAFQQDLSTWCNFKAVLKNGKVAVFANNKKIYSSKYRNSLGKIRGLRFRCFGYGMIDYVHLYNGNNALIYKDEF